MILFVCPHCTRELRVSERFVGTRGACNFCGETITITNPEAPPGQEAVEAPKKWNYPQPLPLPSPLDDAKAAEWIQDQRLLGVPQQMIEAFLFRALKVYPGNSPVEYLCLNRTWYGIAEEMESRNEAAARFEEEGKIPEAIECYEENVLALYRDPLPYMRLRELYARRKNFDNAITACMNYLSVSRDLKERAKFQDWVDQLRYNLDKAQGKTPKMPKHLFVAIEIKTSGQDPKLGGVIEVGGIKFDLDGEVEDTFQEFADPGHEIIQAVTKLTGIMTRMVRGARPPVVVLMHLFQWAGSDRLFVVHDARVIAQAIKGVYAAKRKRPPALLAVDTLEWARAQAFPLPDCKLHTLLAHLQLSIGGQNRALVDAQGAMELALHFAKQGESPRQELLEHAGELPPRPPDPPTPRDLHCLRTLEVPPPELEGMDRRQANRLIAQYAARKAESESEAAAQENKKSWLGKVWK